jgi:hypothetical protein
MRRGADRNQAPVFAGHKLAHGALLFRLELGIGSRLIPAPGHGREAGTLAPVLRRRSVHSQSILFQRGFLTPIAGEGCWVTDNAKRS